jgi:hypothetical protein
MGLRLQRTLRPGVLQVRVRCKLAERPPALRFRTHALRPGSHHDQCFPGNGGAFQQCAKGKCVRYFINRADRKRLIDPIAAPS